MWNDESAQLLANLWKENKTASQITFILNTIFPDWGVSRNAVIGKAHRMKLKKRSSPIRKTFKKRKAPKLSTGAEKANYESFSNVPKDCCLWPLDKGWCGKKQTKGRLPYCEDHYKRAVLNAPKINIEKSFLY